MELICLDTSILIEHRRSKDKSKSMLFRLASQYTLAISSITIFELWKGDNSGEDDFWLQLFSRMKLLDFNAECAKIAGKDYLDLKLKGQMIDIEDILIGATAKHHQLKIATSNLKHYSRIEGLELVDLVGL